MAVDHPLSRGAQALSILLSLLLVVHLAHSLRALRLHLRSPRVALQASLLRQFHLPLSSCLRLAVLAVSVCGIVGAVAATTAAFLQLPVMDARLRFVSLLHPAYPFSAASQACIAFAKLGPASYAALKAFSYVFYFLKARTVRPLERMTPLERLALLATLGVFGAAVVALWISNGDRSAIDGQCQFHVPLWLIGVMLASDVVISVLYLYLFIAATRGMMALQSQQKRGSVFGPTTLPQKDSRVALLPTGQAQAQALAEQQPPVVAVQVWNEEDESELLPAPTTAPTAPSVATESDSSAPPSSVGAIARLHMSSQLEKVMRKNTWSCCICIAITVAVLGEICAAHASRQVHLLKLMWPLMLVDMVATAAALTHLMHNSRKSGGFVAAADAVAAVTGAAHAAVSDSKVHPGQLMSPSNGTTPAAAPAGRCSGVQQLQLNLSEHTAPSLRKLSNPGAGQGHGSPDPLSPALQAQTLTTHTRPSLFVTLRPSPSLAHVTTLTSSVDLQSTSPSPLGPAGAGGVTASPGPGPASKYHVLPSGSSSSLMLPQSGMAYAYATASLQPLPKPVHAASAASCEAATAATGTPVDVVPLQLPGEATHTDEPPDIDAR